MTHEEIAKLHRKAMQALDKAETAKRAGDESSYNRLLRRALDQEREAANATVSDLAFEPTRSVLHRSAAYIALDAGDARLAEQLAAAALAGDPPAAIAEELRDVLEQVNFTRHLQLRGIELHPDEMQLAFSGPTAGWGLMEKSAVYVRLDALENLIYRTAERRSGLDYRDAGSPMQDIKSTYPLFISKARAGSFAMSVRIGSPLGEPIFPQWREGLTVENVLDDVVEGLESVNSGRLDSLHERIPEEAYFRNFVSLSRSLSPDGGRVTQCALTLVRGTSRREVSLTKLRKDIRIPTTERPGETLVVVRGVLKYADELRPAKREIRLVDSDNNEVKISVPQGLNDIVRPLWGRLVEVEGGKTRNRISLREIREVEADEEPPSFPYRPTSPEPGSLFR